MAFQLVRNFDRQIFRPPQSVPRHKLETLYAGFFDRRYFRCGSGALEAGEGQRLDLAPLRERERREHRIGKQLDLSAHEVGERGCRPLVGNDEGLETGVAFQLLNGEMAGRGDGGGAESEFLRIPANEIKKVPEVV